MRFYVLEQSPHPRYSGYYSYGHRWGLPGAYCPVCHVNGATAGESYPSVDLSHLSAEEQKKYLPRVEEDYAEFERLREQVRPLVPPGARLQAGTGFGPLNGSAQGEFGPLVLAHPWELLMKPEPLARLQAEGTHGLKGCRTALHFRKKNPPELLEMELLSWGRFHPDCLPERPPPCPRCGIESFDLPEHPFLDATTLPKDLDLFRLEWALIIGTERFVEAVQRLGLAHDLTFRELPVRGG